jgi:zinc protease
VREANLSVTSPPAQGPAALPVGEQELRRARTHGLQAPELNEVLASFITSLDQAVKTASTRRSNGLASIFSQHLLHRHVATQPAAERALCLTALAKIPVADCLAARRASFSSPGRCVMVTDQAQIPGDANAAIVAAYDTSRAVKIPAPAEVAEAQGAAPIAASPAKSPNARASKTSTSPLSSSPTASASTSKKRFRSRTHQSPRPRPPGQRDATARPTRPRYAFRRRLHVRRPRQTQRRRTSPDQRREGRRPRILLLGLQLLTAYLTDSSYRPEAMRLAQNGIGQMYLGFEHTANGPMAMEVANLLRGGDPRFGVPPKVS